MAANTFLRRWTLRLTVAYFLLIPLSVAWYWLDTEDRAFTSLFLYSPRWLLVLPLIALVALAILARSRWAFGIGLITGIGILGPLMGGRIGISTWPEPPPAYARYRVMTWNAGNAGSSGSINAFRSLQDESQPDIIVLQECPSEVRESDFPNGWTVMSGGHGLRVASRFRGRHEETLGGTSLVLPGSAGRYIIETPDGLITIYNLHLPTPRPGIEAAMQSKFLKFGELKTVLELQAKSSKTVREWIRDPQGLFLIAGDFNLPVESRLYRRDWGGFQNAFSEVGCGWGGTKTTKWHSVRIDHILSGSSFHIRRCFVGPDLGSDHRPLIADMTLEEGQ